MRFQSRLALVVAVVSAFQGCQRDTRPPEPAETTRPLDAPQVAIGGPDGSRVFFEPNQGQTDSRASFIGRGSGSQMFLVEDGVVLRSAGSRGSTVRLRFLGSKGGPFVSEAPLTAVSNYFIGAQESRWLRRVPRFSKVTQKSLYEGVDVAYYGARDGSEQLEFDLIVGVGADPSAVRIRYEGGGAIPRVDDSGSLRIDTPGGRLLQLAPQAFQDIDGVRVPVRARYEVASDGTVTIELDPYSREHVVVIDPVLVYRTLIGGVEPVPGQPFPPESEDRVLDIAVSGTGSAFGIGFSRTLDFPTTAGAFQEASAGDIDAVVFKLDADGQLAWATYLGGDGDDIGNGIAIDEVGIHVVGDTGSSDFPLASAFQAVRLGPDDAFVATLSLDGTALPFATLLGGGGQDSASDIVIDASGALVVGGTTNSGDFPLTDNAFDSEPGGLEGFVTRLRNGSLDYSTFVGGRQTIFPSIGPIDGVSGVAVDSAGNIVACGATFSLDFPQLNPIDTQNTQAFDAFVLKLDSSGDSLVFSTTLGGSSPDSANGCVVDRAGDILVVGATESSGFPVSTDAFQPLMRGVGDAFISKLSADGQQFRYSTFFGGDGRDRASAVAVDDLGHAYVVGVAAAESFPLRNGNLTPLFPGGAFLSRFDSSGSSLVYSTFLAGSGGRTLALALTIAVDSRHHAFVAGGDYDDSLQQLDAVVLEIGPVETTITSGPLDGGDDTPAFTFTSSEEGSAFECAIDGVPFAACASPFESAPVATGSHLFEARAITQYGDIDDSPARFEFSIAPGASDVPETAIVSGPPAATNDTSVTFEFTANRPGATFECALNLDPFETCASPLAVGPLSFGAYVFRVRAISVAGVTDETPAEQSFQVAPDTTLLAVPPSRSALASVAFEFASNDAGASFDCALDADPFGACSSPWNFVIAEGSHTFSVRAKHGFIADPTPATYGFVIDRSGPSLVLVPPGPVDGGSAQASPVSMTISASEPAIVTGSNLFAAGTVVPAGTSNATVSLRPGYNTFSTFVRDDLGNSSLFTFHLFLDATPPTLVFLSPPNASSTYHSPINVLVSLSEDVTVVTSSPGFLSPIGGTLLGGERTLRLSLVAGLNEFSATLRDRAGNETTYAGPSAFSLTLATERPPAPLISSPAPGTVSDQRLAAVAGTASGNAVRVQITGASTVSVPVTAGGNWSGTVTLPQGASRIRAVAYSAAGAASPEASVPITTSGGTQLIAVDSGNSQLGPTGAALALPLTARVTDLSGAALCGIPVTFSIDVEPVSIDGYLGGTGKTATATTDGAGCTAAVPLTLATSHVNEQGVMQPTLVTATVPSLSGTRAVFAAQGLPIASFGPGTGTATPTYLIPIGRDCTASADRPVGSCPLGAAGTAVSGFTVAVLDETYRLLPDAGVDFTAARGTFGASPTIHLQTGPDGIAHSGSFTLSQTIPNSEGLFVMLRPGDLAATPLQLHGVTAALSAQPSVQMGFAAYAHAGPTARIVDVSPGILGSSPGIPARNAIIGRVEDSFGNPRANASLTFSVVPIADPDDPGAKLFRSDPTASSASQCTHVLSKNDDTCTMSSLSATTFSGGTAWTQLAMGMRGFTPYEVTASASGAVPVTITRRSNYIDPGEWIVLQASITAAATFAIVETENDNTDPITAVRWSISCDGPAGSPLCAVGRGLGKISFDAIGGAHFNPPFESPFQQTSIANGEVLVAPGEVRSLLVGGARESALILVVWFTYFGQERFVSTNGAQAVPLVESTRIPVATQCALDPRMSRAFFCGGIEQPDPTLTCVPNYSTGIGTYVDLTNGETENNVVSVRMRHGPTSPKAGEVVAKFSGDVVLGVGFPPITYFNFFAGMSGVPGVYDLSGNRWPFGALDTVPIDFDPGWGGCVAFVTKSYQRFSAAPGGPPPPPPSDAELRFETPGGVSLGPSLRLPGWVDAIARRGGASGDPREGTTDCPLPQCGCDCVADWVQMRAWEVFDHPPELLGGSVAIPIGGDDATGIPGMRVVQAELDEIFFGAPSVRDTLVLNPAVAAETSSIPIAGATDSDWSVFQEIKLNVRSPEMRTSEPGNFLSNGIITVETADVFSAILAHEARHAWQGRVAVISGAAFVDEETFYGLPNRNPNNNDDIRFPGSSAFRDCLPERAVLPDGTDLGAPGGSAVGLADSLDNQEFGINSTYAIMGGAPVHGERPDSAEIADTCSSGADSGDTGSRAIESDAIRFSLALEPLR